MSAPRGGPHRRCSCSRGWAALWSCCWCQLWRAVHSCVASCRDVALCPGCFRPKRPGFSICYAVTPPRRQAAGPPAPVVPGIGDHRGPLLVDELLSVAAPIADAPPEVDEGRSVARDQRPRSRISRARPTEGTLPPATCTANSASRGALVAWWSCAGGTIRNANARCGCVCAVL